MNRYFKVGTSSNSGPRLFEVDTVNNKILSDRGQRYCDFLSTIEADTMDIVKASGDITWACNKIDSVLVIKVHKVADLCSRSIPNLTGQFGLADRYWYCESISLNGKVYKAPCGYNPGMQFNSNGRYDAQQVVNSTTAQYLLAANDSIKLGQGAATLALPRTKYQRSFENAFNTLLNSQPGGVVMKYTLRTNHLVLTSKRGSVSFFCRN